MAFKKVQMTGILGLFILIVSATTGAGSAFAQIYFSAGEQIQVLQPGEESATSIVDADAYGLEVDLENGYIYWTESAVFGSELKRVNLDGTNEIILDDGSESARGLAIDYENEFIYWADLVNNGSIWRVGLDGDNPTELIAGESNGVTDGILDVALDTQNGHIYWIKFGAVMRADLDGSNIQPFTEFASYKQPASLELDVQNGYVYWIDASSDDILRASMDTGNPETVIDGQEPEGLSVDPESGFIFWIDNFLREGKGELHVAALDGSDPQLIMETGLTRGGIFAAGWELTTSGETLPEQPAGIQLSQNFPNPFNPSTIIEYSLPQSMPVTLTIHNSLGQQVAILADGDVRQSGVNQHTFDASDLSSGIYFYRLTAGEMNLTKKMTLIK